jgi:multidrug efflux system outer membrane protein
MSQRLEVGEITRLEYQVALSNIHQVRIQFERSKQILQQSKNALILLVGTEIDNELLSNPPSSKMVLLQELSAGSPSSLLLNRPDIRAAEHRLMAQNANIGVARAAFFPRISLTALFGGISPELSTLFDSNQQSWSVGSSINIPIFNGGKNSANLDLAVLRKEIAIAAYEGTIQDAFHEVSNALVALHAIKNQSAAQKQSSQAADYRHELSTQRYQQGSDSLFNLLEAQKFAITNQLALVEAQAKEQLTLVTLFRSLGGGWYTADSPSDSKPIAL